MRQGQAFREQNADNFGKDQKQEQTLQEDKTDLKKDRDSTDDELRAMMKRLMMTTMTMCEALDDITDEMEKNTEKKKKK